MLDCPLHITPKLMDRRNARTPSWNSSLERMCHTCKTTGSTGSRWRNSHSTIQNPLLRKFPRSWPTPDNIHAWDSNRRPTCPDHVIKLCKPKMLTDLRKP